MKLFQFVIAVYFNNMLVSQALLVMLLTFQGCSCALQETVSRIKENSEFETIFIFGKPSPENLPRDFPTIYFTTWTPLEIRITFNNQILTIAFIDDLNTLDNFMSYFKKLCAPKILLVSKKLTKKKIFEKFHNHSLPNAVLLQGGALFTFCCVNGNTPLEIFEISQTKIFKEHWIKMYRQRNVHWNMSYVSASRTCNVGYTCKVLRVFGQLYYGLEQIFLYNESSNPVIMRSARNHIPFYEILSFMELIGIVVVIPTDYSSNEMREFFYLPFDKYTWLSYALTLFYFALVLSLLTGLSSGASNFSHSLLNALEILMGRGINFKSTRALHRMILLTMSIFGFVLVTLYGTYLGSFVITSVGNRKFEVICEELRFQIFNKFQPEESQQVNWKMLETPIYVSNSLLMDSKYGYCLYSNEWLIFESFQGGLTHKHFQLLYRTPDNQWFSSFIQRVYSDSFLEYFVNIYSFGLISKWKNDNYLKGYIQSMIKDIQKRNAGSDEMAVHWLKWPSILCLFLYFISSLVFLGEICHKMFNK